MTEAAALDPESPRFPLGRFLIAIGLVGLVATIGLTFWRLYEDMQKTYGSIITPSPTPLDLPTKGIYVLTRADGLSEDRSLVISYNSPASSGESTFESGPDGRWISIKSQRNQILGDFTMHTSGPVTITATAAAYPLTVRRDPLDLTIEILKFSAAVGTAAAIILTAGVIIGVRNYNRELRQRQQFLEA